MQTTPQAHALLLGQGGAPAEETPRERFGPIQQAYYGSRDLTFGSAFYRPGVADLNDTDDVAGLAGYLDSLRPENWSANRLAALDLDDPEERAEELEYVRDWFTPFHDLYRRALQHGQVVVCEIVEGAESVARALG